jgi:hypothetical protein
MPFDGSVSPASAGVSLRAADGLGAAVRCIAESPVFRDTLSSGPLRAIAAGDRRAVDVD